MQIGNPTKEPQIKTSVRNDVFVEIGNRATTITAIYGPPDNTITKKMAIKPSDVGWGPCVSSVTSASSTLSKLSNPANFQSLLKQIPAAKAEDDDDIEALFADSEEEAVRTIVKAKEPALDSMPTEAASDHVDVNKKNRDKRTQAQLEQFKNTGQTDQHRVDIPRMITQWYTVCSEKLRKSHINDIPRMYRSNEDMPPIDTFIATDAGDTLLKFARYLGNIFR